MRGRARSGIRARLRRYWSPNAALRALRATVVVPGLLALTFEVAGNGQMALFAVFGSFATLVMTSFGGGRRDKAVAHLGLAVVGSAAIVIGTAVAATPWLAVLVTIPVAFGIFLGGVAGPNSASGVTGALLAYVLPVASPGGFGTVPDRLAGWWLASVAGTAAVLLLTRRPDGAGLRAVTAACAQTLAGQLAAAAAGQASAADRDASAGARNAMMAAFLAAPYRPTGLAVVDQALANLIHLLDWCVTQACDALAGHQAGLAAADADLLGAAASLLRDAAALLGDGAGPDPSAGSDPLAALGRLEDARRASLANQQRLAGEPAQDRACAVAAVHAQSIATTVRAIAADALIAARRAGPDEVAAVRRRWFGAGRLPAAYGRAMPAVARVVRSAMPHADVRSLWFRSAARGALALALAVAVADLSGVQHGFWVVLGTLSVLRTNAAATGATALRALAGTVAGFVIGAALMLAIGTGPAALWTVLPLAVLAAAYAPGVLPFAVGQAGFTVTVVVLFNLLVPVGWQVGLLRVEDVAIGCAVSVAVGFLFWPHGASSVVGDGLADAFGQGSAYLTQAVDWALGLRAQAPDTAVATVTAAIRLDDGLRGYLAEQGAKRLTKDDLWRLVMATTRLRLTAYSVAGLRTPAPDGAARVGLAGEPDLAALSGCAAELAGFYRLIAGEVGRPGAGHAGDTGQATWSAVGAAAWHGRLVHAAFGPGADPRTVWVGDHLRHLGAHADAIAGPAGRLAAKRRAPWWR